MKELVDTIFVLTGLLIGITYTTTVIGRIFSKEPVYPPQIILSAVGWTLYLEHARIITI